MCKYLDLLLKLQRFWKDITAVQMFVCLFFKASQKSPTHPCKTEIFQVHLARTHRYSSQVKNKWCLSQETIRAFPKAYLLPEFANIYWNPFFCLRVQLFLYQLLPIKGQSIIYPCLKKHRKWSFIKCCTLVSLNMPLFFFLLYHFTAIVSKMTLAYQVLHTEDTNFHLHADHFYINGSFHSITIISVSTKPSILGFWIVFVVSIETESAQNCHCLMMFHDIIVL